MFEQILGIVLGPGRIDLCQANRGIKSLEIVNAASHDIPREISDKGAREIGEWIRSLCLGNQRQPDVIISALPCGSAMYRQIHLPFADMNKVAKVYPYEVEQTLPCPLDDVIMAFQTIDSNKATGTDILVAIVKKRDFETHLAILEAAGFEPVATTLEPVGLLSLHRALHQKKREGIGCILDIAPNRGVLTIFDRQGILRTREIDSDDTSVLCDQVRLTITSFATENSQNIDALFLTGEPRMVASFENLFALSGSIEIRQLDPFEGALVQQKERGASLRPFFAAPLGLCMVKKFKRGGAWNFRQADYAYQKTYKLPRQNAMVLASLAACLIILWAINLACRSGYYKNRLQVLQNQAQGILGKAIPEVSWGPDALTRIKDLIEKETLIQKQYKDFFGNAPNALDILRELSIRIPKENNVLIQEVLLQDTKIRVKGRTETFEMLDKIKTGLEKSMLFNEVKINEANIKGTGNQVSFNIMMELQTGNSNPDS